jgi:spore germination protein KA
MRYISKKGTTKTRIPAEELITQGISADHQVNIDNLKVLLNRCSEAVIREFTLGRESSTRCVLLYFDGISDKAEIEEHLIKPLLQESANIDQLSLEGIKCLQSIKDKVLSLSQLSYINTLEEICHHINSGDAVLLVDGSNQGLSAGTRYWESRSIQTPENELTIQGPKDGFNETLRYNTALIRRRLKTTQLKTEILVIGRLSKTDVLLSYIEDIAPPSMVAVVRDRLLKINLDGILDSGYLETYISDCKWTMFSQVEYTERPDRTCAHLLEGGVAIMVDGSPMALLAPITFPQFLISAEDYYQNFVAGSIYRILRFLAFFAALTLPSFYVAITSFHHEMIPTDLYLAIASTREGIPFPAVVEAFLLELTFELLREAGLRLPRAIGPAVSIVGALIIGEAAVRAGLVSGLMVVVVAFTGIASFAIPFYNASVIIRVARFGILLAAGFLGLPGIIMALLLMLIRMENIQSLGKPYLSPLSPLEPAQISDILVRRPWPMNIRRPYLPGMLNRNRQSAVPKKGG